MCFLISSPVRLPTAHSFSLPPSGTHTHTHRPLSAHCPPILPTHTHTHTHCLSCIMYSTHRKTDTHLLRHVTSFSSRHMFALSTHRYRYTRLHSLFPITLAHLHVESVSDRKMNSRSVQDVGSLSADAGLKTFGGRLWLMLYNMRKNQIATSVMKSVPSWGPKVNMKQLLQPGFPL